MATPAGPVVIVGSGLAAVSFAGTLRQGGYRGPLTLVGEESEPPYDRPPLSKGFLRDGDADKIRLEVARLTDVQWRLGVRGVRLDTERRLLSLSSGDALPWSTLVLATGTRPRPFDGLSALRRLVSTLRTLDDARRIRSGLMPGARLLLVGAGVIGLELAATARAMDVEVTVVESQPRVMGRSVPAGLSDYLERRHRERGVDLRLGVTIAGCREGVAQLDDGTEVTADLAVVGTGVVANDELARQAGIECRDGVIVDARGRTSADGVIAVGDVARQPHPLTGALERVETWANAQNQAAASARAWLDPAAPPYEEAPWFWSDQYEMRMQCVGLAAGTREFVRGSVDQDRFCLLHFDDRRLVGASCVNAAKDFAALRRLVGRRFDHPDRAWADPGTDLRKLA